MTTQAIAPRHDWVMRAIAPARYNDSRIAAFLKGRPLLDIGERVAIHAETLDYPVVFSGYILQDTPNYRLAIQSWFDQVCVGGYLVITVPHSFLYERQHALPSRWNFRQRRLYTPRSLMEEIEEALLPNTYRVACLTDCDADYNYMLASDIFPKGQHDIALALQKIAPPSWHLSDQPVYTRPPPEVSFELLRTRAEVAATVQVLRILILKMDHLGDFIMGLPALKKARATFPEAEITLVVGSWNLAMAQQLGLFDKIIAFDGFPRNAGEEKTDVRGKVSEFQSAITGEYDLAIDLRTDHDTRPLLESAHARIKAGIGSKAQFQFLDIFLPIDFTRRSETAWERQISVRDFAAQPYCERSRYQISCDVQSANPDRGAIIWGPYHHLSPGSYAFEPFVEFQWNRPSIIRYDIALDMERVFDGVISDGILNALYFSNSVDGARFEFRLQCFEDQNLPKFQFFGGVLSKRGSESVLHQSEYLSMLIELVSMRIDKQGVLQEWDVYAG